MTSLQDLSGEYAFSPPPIRLDSQSDSFLGASPSSSPSRRGNHRRHSSISLEDLRAVGAPSEVVLGPGRRWQVDIVGDRDGQDGEGKFFQLCFTGDAILLHGCCCVSCSRAPQYTIARTSWF